MLPLVAPRATYPGWNPRAEGYGAGAIFPLQARRFRSPPRAEREASGDPRPSLGERYADSPAYVAAVRAAAARMVAEGLLLPQDAERAIELATQACAIKASCFGMNSSPRGAYELLSSVCVLKT